MKPSHSLSLLLIFVVGVIDIFSFSIHRLQKPRLLVSLSMSALTHSAVFNRFKSVIKESDNSFTIEELNELQDLIKLSIDEKKLQLESPSSLRQLCQVTKDACTAVTPMLKAFYAKISEAENVKGTEYFVDRTAKLKADATFFSIADGIVQHMFIDFLFAGNKFAQIVGEEDETKVNLTNRPYTVDDLVVPDEFNELVEATLEKIKSLADRIDPVAYKGLTVFCDPIDGTREFATGKGEYVSILIGYNDKFGKPIAGIMYRPLTNPPTWAAGAASENCVMGELDMAEVPNPKGVLVTDGKVSKFLSNLIEELGYEKVNSLASGNRALMLLEGKAGAYIRDSGGFAKWDTCGPEAVIEAYGGTMSKLTQFIADKTLESYTHLKTDENLDFEPGTVTLTLSNAKDKKMVKKDEVKVVVDGMTTTTYTVSSKIIAKDAHMVKEYACVQGLVALDKDNLDKMDKIHAAMMKVMKDHPPYYT